MLGKQQQASFQCFIRQLFFHSLFAYALFAAYYLGSGDFRHSFVHPLAKNDSPVLLKSTWPLPTSSSSDPDQDGQLFDDGQRFLRAVDRFLREMGRNRITETVQGSVYVCFCVIDGMPQLS